MSWVEFHNKAETLAREAEDARKAGYDKKSRSCYSRAAGYETLAIEALDEEKSYTFDVTVISAAALRFKAEEYLLALGLVRRYAASDKVSTFALRQLKEIGDAATDKSRCVDVRD